MSTLLVGRGPWWSGDRVVTQFGRAIHYANPSCKRPSPNDAGDWGAAVRLDHNTEAIDFALPAG